MLSLSLFFGGGYILSLKIPFWSMFLGIAAIQIGIVLIILTFEVFTKRRTKAITEDYKAIPCLVCKKLNYVPKFQRTTICDNCQLKIANISKTFVVIIIAFFSLASFTYLVKSNRDIRRQAGEKKYYCQEGIWNPKDCSCAQDEKFDCPQGQFPRKCMDDINYCCKG